MKKLFLMLLTLSMMVVLVPAQDDAPLFQVNGGWLYNRYGSLNMYQGFDVGFTYWMNNYFGIMGDFSGNYADYPDYYGQQLVPDKLHFYNYLFGIKLASWDNENFVPFSHFLLGAGSSITKYPAQGGGTMSHSETAFAYAIGGGVDIKITDNIWFRPFMMDYVGQTGANKGNQMRISVGIVFGFGER